MKGTMLVTSHETVRLTLEVQPPSCLRSCLDTLSVLGRADKENSWELSKEMVPAVTRLTDIHLTV